MKSEEPTVLIATFDDLFGVIRQRQLVLASGVAGLVVVEALEDESGVGVGDSFFDFVVAGVHLD